MITRTTLCTAVLLLAGGCQNLQNHQQSRQQAEQRFNQQKARIKFLLASEQFDRGQIAKARETLLEVLTLAENQPDYYLLLAKIHLEQGQLAKARKLLETLTADRRPTPEIHYLFGLIAERYGETTQATEHYRQACDLAPHEADYIMAYGEALIGLNRAAEVLDLINDQLRDANDFGRLQMLRAEAAQMLGRFDEAADAYRKAYIEHPRDYKLFESYAMALFRAGRYREAITPLTSIRERRQDQAPDHLVRALAACHIETGEAVSALELLRGLTRKRTADAQSWILYARCMTALSSHDQARYAAERAVALAPDNLDAQLVRAYACFRLDDLEAAQQALAAALRINPRDVTALCLLGQIFETTGLAAQALEFYERALKVDEQDPLARQLHEQLSRGIAKQG